MESAATRCGGNRSLLDQNFGLLQIQSNRNDRPCSLTIRNHSRGKTEKKLTATTTSLKKNRSTQSAGIESGWNRSGTEAVAYEKLDEWMRDSVVKIVKNLREAPLMLRVYNKEKGSQEDGVESKIVMEKGASAGDWSVMKDKWEAGDAPLPEGLIFVEELGDDSERHEEDVNDRMEGMTTAWGVVVQGKGVECPPACYLLKTSTAGAGSGCGLGLGCTHFCLVRVNSFRETAAAQLTNCWL